MIGLIKIIFSFLFKIASTLFNCDIILVPVFPEEAHDQSSGTITFSPQSNDLAAASTAASTASKRGPLYLLWYSKQRFLSPHFQSIRPKKETGQNKNVTATTTAAITMTSATTATTPSGPLTTTTTTATAEAELKLSRSQKRNRRKKMNKAASAAVEGSSETAEEETKT